MTSQNDQGTAPRRVPVNEVLFALDARPEKPGGEHVGPWLVRCVVHTPDNNPSMLIQRGDRTPLTFYCRSCGATHQEIVGILRLKGLYPITQGEVSFPNTAFLKARRKQNEPPTFDVRPLKDDDESEPLKVPPPRDGYAHVATYVFRAPGGMRQGVRWRYEKQDPEVNGSDKYFYSGWCDGKAFHFDYLKRNSYIVPRPKQFPLYGLEALSAKPGVPALFVEGEKTRDAAERLFPEYAVVSFSGMGGYDNLKHYNLAPLKDRRVIYLPDADRLYLKAAEKRTTYLAGFAIEARLAHLPQRLADELPGWDCADEFPEFFAVADLRACLNTAKAYVSEERAIVDKCKTVHDLTRLWIFVTAAKLWYAREKLTFTKTKEDFDDTFGHLAPTRGSLSRWLLKEAGSRSYKVSSTAYLPYSYASPPPDLEDKVDVLNTYSPPDLTPVPCDYDDPDLVKYRVFVTRLFGPSEFGADESDAEGRILCKTESNGDQFVHAWLTALVQRPDKRPPYMLTILGKTQGTGKTMFVNNVPRRLVNPDNAKDFSKESFGKFNAELADTLLGTLEDFGTFELEDTENLKKYITEEMNVRLRTMYVMAFQGRICAWFVATSNSDQPIKFAKGEANRRYKFMYVAMEVPMPIEYYEDYGAFFADDYVMGKILYSYRHHYSLAQFSIDAPPVNDSHKARYEQAAWTDKEREIHAAYSNGVSPFDPGLWTIEAFKERGWRRNLWVAKEPSTQQVMNILRKLGARVSSKQVRVKTGEKWDNKTIVLVGSAATTEAAWQREVGEFAVHDKANNGRYEQALANEGRVMVQATQPALDVVVKLETARRDRGSDAYGGMKDSD